MTTLTDIIAKEKALFLERFDYALFAYLKEINKPLDNDNLNETPYGNFRNSVIAALAASLTRAIQQFVEMTRDIVKQVEIERAHTYSSENADIYRAYDSGQGDMKLRILLAVDSKQKEIINNVKTV